MSVIVCEMCVIEYMCVCVIVSVCCVGAMRVTLVCVVTGQATLGPCLFRIPCVKTLRSWDTCVPGSWKPMADGAHTRDTLTGLPVTGLVGVWCVVRSSHVLSSSLSQQPSDEQLPPSLSRQGRQGPLPG